MLPNSSNKAEAQTSLNDEASVGRPRSLRRRISLAILLPVWVAIGFVLSQVILVALVYMLYFAGVSLTGVDSALRDTVIAALVYLLTLLIVIVFPGVIKKSSVTLAELGLSRLPEWKDILLAIAGFAVYFLCAGVLISLVSRFVPGFNVDQSQNVGFDHLVHHYEYFLAFVTLVIVAPVAEEVLMRGYLYGRLRKIIPVIWAMIVTAALFAALHLQWNVAVDVFALSLVLTSLRETSDSIWAGILVHMMKNGLAFYLLFINTALFHTMGR